MQAAHWPRENWIECTRSRTGKDYISKDKRKREMEREREKERTKAYKRGRESYLRVKVQKTRCLLSCEYGAKTLSCARITKTAQCSGNPGFVNQALSTSRFPLNLARPIAALTTQKAPKGYRVWGSLVGVKVIEVKILAVELLRIGSDIELRWDGRKDNLKDHMTMQDRLMCNLPDCLRGVRKATSGKFPEPFCGKADSLSLLPATMVFIKKYPKQ